ncbi:MAG: PEP-CTERM sorting domain-containing protein [Planctomycetales bacterium]|nr:PEP-CTERM sorting domain-containing protein [Planctomycetales bacterium]
MLASDATRTGRTSNSMRFHPRRVGASSYRCHRRPQALRLAALAVGLTLAFAGSSPAAIISQFTFDAGNANDSVGANNGTLVGTAAVVNDATRGNVLSVDGNSDYSNHLDSASLDLPPQTAISLTSWFNKTSAGQGSLVVKEQNSSAGYGLEANAGTLRFFLFGAGNSSLIGGAFSNGAWNHAAGTWDGTTARLYLNGIEVTSGGYAGPFTTNSEDLRIGHGKISGNAENYFGGLIDDVGVWDSGLTGQDVALIHGLGLFAGVGQTDQAIADAQTVFGATSGTFITSGGQIWAYGTGLGAGVTGTTGGSVGALDAFIILDGAGGGIQLVGLIPEPSTAVLLGLGMIGMTLRRRRRGQGVSRWTAAVLALLAIAPWMASEAHAVSLRPIAHFDMDDDDALSPTQSGYTSLDLGTGFATENGVTLTIAGGLSDDRDRDELGLLVGHPDADILRDFAFVAGGTDVLLDLTGLAPYGLYEVTITSFDRTANNGEVSEWFDTSVSGSLLATHTNNTADPDAADFSFMISASPSGTFRIAADPQAGSNIVIFNSLGISQVVPEPSTALLLGIGLVGLCVRRRRESRKVAKGHSTACRLGRMLTATVATAACLAMSSPAQAYQFLNIDIDSDNGGGPDTNPGWTSLLAPQGLVNTGTVTADGVTFTVFSGNSSRTRFADDGATALTRDFAFDNGAANVAVGLTIDDLRPGLWTASVYAWDDDQPALGNQIVGLIEVGTGTTILTNTFQPHPTEPFTFSFISDGVSQYQIFTRENNATNLAVVNALSLSSVPEPSTAMLGLLSLIGLAARRRRRSR